MTGYGLDDQRVGVQVPVGSRISLLHIISTSTGDHPTFYPMATEGFPGGKVAGARG
jgi:hypothetical protein